MEKGGSVSMDASVIQDVWDWEVLPDEHRSFYAESRAASPHGHGGAGEVVLADQETEEPPSEDADADECKDIGVDVVVPGETRSAGEESMPTPATVTELLASGHGEKEEETFKSSDAKQVDDDDKVPVAAEEEAEAAAAAAAREFAGEEEEAKKKERAAPAARKRPECVVFSVGKLRVNGVGALCSFGVAAATVGVFLVGGRLQHQQKQQQQQKIQLQFIGDDKRMQQVVQQTSRLNQAMSSMMGAGASTRAKISFGGLYDGF